jgi:WhiB family redox-sensing transcriptional regulator
MAEELPTGWAQLGRCQGRPDLSELFYSDRAEDQKKAKKYCKECEVRTECLAYAILTREPFGVWGGRTSAERRTMWKYGNAFSSFTDDLRHQLIASVIEAPTVSSDPASWDWSL